MLTLNEDLAHSLNIYYEDLKRQYAPEDLENHVKHLYVNGQHYMPISIYACQTTVNNIVGVVLGGGNGEAVMIWKDLKKKENQVKFNGFLHSVQESEINTLHVLDTHI